MTAIDREKLREQFEAAYVKEHCETLNEYQIKEMLFISANGEYSSFHVRGAWWGYQAGQQSKKGVSDE